MDVEIRFKIKILCRNSEFRNTVESSVVIFVEKGQLNEKRIYRVINGVQCTSVLGVRCTFALLAYRISYTRNTAISEINPKTFS